MATEVLIFRDLAYVFLAAVQAGLGLPERDYYLKKDDKSAAMREHAEATCAALGLSYRVKQLCTADIGFSARLVGMLADRTLGDIASRPATTFSNLADGSTFTANGNTFQANYEGGDGNDLTLTVVP